MDALVRATALAGYQEFVRELGYDANAFLRRFHIAPDLPGKEDGYLPFRTLIQLFNASAEEFDCPDFGLRLAEYQGIEILGPLALIARHCDTVGEAFEAICKYFYVQNRGTIITLEQSEREAPRLIFETTLTEAPPLRQIMERSLGVGHNVLRLLSGAEYTAEAVLFAHSTPLPMKRYRDFFQTEVWFNQPINALIFRREDLSRPLAQKDVYLKRVFTNYINKIVDKPQLDLREQVKTLIKRLLPTGHCTINIVAEHLCLHPRTLQRRLAEADLSFERLLDEIRRDSASAYLSNPTIPLAQLASLLGYTEQSSLNRACQRWFGRPPRQYRVTTLSAQSPRRK